MSELFGPFDYVSHIQVNQVENTKPQRSQVADIHDTAVTEPPRVPKLHVI